MVAGKGTGHRDYRKEYDNYQGTDKQKKNRASRNKARHQMIAAGKAHKGDGKDVMHKNGSPRDDKMSNYKLGTEHENRSYPRTRKAHKVNKTD